MPKPYLRIITQRFAAGADFAKLPLNGNFLRVLASGQPIAFVLGDETVVELVPGMGVFLDEEQAFKELRMTRTDATDAGAVQIAVGWQSPDKPLVLTDNRSVADISATVAAAAMSVPAPVQWRFVPKITYTEVDGKHKWTEVPDVDPNYGTAEAITDYFTDDGHKCVCIALANPRVIKRRIITSTGQFFIAASPTSFDADGNLVSSRARVVGPGQEAVIDGGSAIFAVPPEAGSGDALWPAIEEWFTPETIALSPNLGTWPDNLAPAQWNKNLP